MMSHAELKVYRAAFYGIDFKHSGVIERDEVEQAFAMAHVDISSEQIKKIFSSSDDPNKLTLSYSEFIICCMNIKNIINKDKLKSAFNYFDIDNSGVIDFNDVRNAMLRYGKNVVNDDDVYKMIKEVTKKETDLIHFEEFYNVFKHLIE
jgi:Ca2+-binding EF-hand superfamily protein